MSVTGKALWCAAALAVGPSCTLSQGQPNVHNSVWMFAAPNTMTAYQLNRNSSAADYLPPVCPQNDTKNEMDSFTNPKPGQLTEQSKNIRQCAEALKILVDLQWYAYADSLWSANSSGNSAADTGKLALTGAATALAGPAGQVLSGIATFVAGVQTTFNQDYLYNKTLQLIVLQMQKDRASQANTIATQLNANSYSNMYEAANDLLEYLRDGSWTHALTTMEADSGAQTAACTQQLQATKKNHADNISSNLKENAKSSTAASTATQPCPAAPINSESAPATPGK